MTTDNFTELKKLFDAECERLKVKTAKVKAHLGGGEHLAPAAAIVKLLDGYTLKECNDILRSSFSIVDRRSKTFKINAEEIEDVL